MRRYKGFRGRVATLGDTADPDSRMYSGGTGPSGGYSPPPPPPPPPPAPSPYTPVSPPPPPPIGSSGAGPGLYSGTGQALPPLTPPPVIQVPPTFPGGPKTTPFTGPGYTTPPIDAGGVPVPPSVFDDPFTGGDPDFPLFPFDPTRLLGPSRGSGGAGRSTAKGADITDVYKGAIDPATGKPRQSSAFPGGGTATKAPLTDEQKKNAGMAIAAIAAFLLLGG